MDKTGNIFDKVDNLSTKLDAVSEQLNKIDNKVNTKIVEPDLSQQERTNVIRRFINRSRREYRWFGSKSKFEFKKNVLLISIGCIWFVMLIASILTGVAFKEYSTFTAFENIWMVLLIFYAKYIYNAEYCYECNKFSKNCFIKFELDSDGTPRLTRPKLFYRISFIVLCISTIGNIICVTTESIRTITFFAIFFEIVVLVANIIVIRFLTYDFFYDYIHLQYTGMNDSKTEEISIVFDPNTNNVFTKEHFDEMFNFDK